MSEENLENVLTEEHYEVLREVMNIGMGQAGDKLARFLGVFIRLSIPRVRLVAAEELHKYLVELVGNTTEVTGVRQAFFTHWYGEAITIFDQAGRKDLAKLMRYPDNLDEEAESELFLDVSNLLTGACINGVAEQLDVELNYSPPSILSKNVFIEELFASSNMSWSHALLTEVNFSMEEYHFKSHLLVMMTTESIITLSKDLEKFIEKM